MKEDFLHYLWKFKQFDTTNLTAFSGETIVVTAVGQYLQQAGPDFFNARLTIGGQKWAGNVEIHLKSSDWYLHQHERDKAYENVILHVVWTHDADVFRSNNTPIPVLELRHYVSPSLLENYQMLTVSKSWIFCEKQLARVDGFVFRNWLERLFFERLERKSRPVFEFLKTTGGDWEAVLFCLLAKNFGLNVNGESFLQLARAIPFSVIRKERHEARNLEALFFGFTGLLEKPPEDRYPKELQSQFRYLCQKYRLELPAIDPLQFFKLRPDNFPTIRLSQLAGLYASRPQLFSDITATDSMADFYRIFGVSVSEYWETHYQFDTASPAKKKPFSKAFIELLVINTIVPVCFAYARKNGKDISENLIRLLCDMPPESNVVIDKFRFFGVASANAFETQSLLQLKKEYCDKGRCLECAAGTALLQ